MGCDGGSIPGRKDLVRQRKSTKAADSVVAVTLSARWQICAMSQTRLQSPIVACHLGMLYNKDAVIRHLINKNELPRYAHIRSLKDVVDIRFTPAPDTDRTEELEQPVFICPVTLLPGNGKYRFYFSSGCGCILSERALKEVASSACLSCHAPLPATIDSDAAIKQHFLILNPSFEEQERMRTALEATRSSKNGKSSKKRKRERKEPDAKTIEMVSSRQASTAPVSDVYASIFKKTPAKIANTLFGNV